MFVQVKKPILMIVAVIISLAMVRLGIWQLDRAEQKREILSQSETLAKLPAVNVESLLAQIQVNPAESRFRQIVATGHYLTEQSILIDNQVFESRVGYALVTPFKLANSDKHILVNRGWLPAGQSRQQLPVFDTPPGQQTLTGRLNFPHAKPPIWNDEFAVAKGPVWQYLPVDQFQQQTGLEVLSLVLELAADESTEMADSSPKINWQSINDEWVAKHQAYAWQWFSMAIVFLIACLIVLVKSMRHTADE